MNVATVCTPRRRDQRRSRGLRIFSACDDAVPCGNLTASNRVISLAASGVIPSLPPGHAEEQQDLLTSRSPATRLKYLGSNCARAICTWPSGPRSWWDVTPMPISSSAPVARSSSCAPGLAASFVTSAARSRATPALEERFAPLLDLVHRVHHQSRWRKTHSGRTARLCNNRCGRINLSV